MKTFFKKFGNEIVFAFVILVCLAFVLNIVILEREYSKNMISQSISRSAYYVNGQKARVSSEINGIRNEAEVFATEVSLCDTEEAFRTVLTNHRVREDTSEYYRDLHYVKDGKMYAGNMQEDEISYPEFDALIRADGVAVSRVFQYRESLMSIAVCADVERSAFADKVILVFDCKAVSLENATTESDGENIADCFAVAEFTLLCKYDGRILERNVGNASFDIGTEPVQDGIVKSLVTDGEAYRNVSRAISNGENIAVNFLYNGERYVLSVDSFGSDNGNLFLVNLFSVARVYGEGFELVQTIWQTVIVCLSVVILISAFYIFNQVRIRRRIYDLAMVEPHLKCPTMQKFEHEASVILRNNKVTKFALVIAKINNFSYINERFGEAGALDLLTFAKNIYGNALLIDEIYAYNSDGEFALLLHYKTRSALEDRLNGLYFRLIRYERFADEGYKMSLSFNVYEVEREKEQSIRRMVEKAMVVKNASGTSSEHLNCNFYGDLLHDNYVKRAEIEGRMESALVGSEFHLFYQPKYNLIKNTIDGSEILVRWFDPEINAYRQPGDFLPIFEEDGFVSKLDRFVFYKACENIASVIASGKTAYPVSVNVSRVTAIQPDFIEYYARIKKKFNIRDFFITLEFTESFAYENYEYLASMISQLHVCGFYCSLDDFGTGYSSYNVLKELNMDEIKLDKFFLTKGVSSERDRIILESVIDIVKKLGVKSTQEGVETKEDYERLQKLGCEVIQGFYFAKPMKYSDYREFVEKNFPVK